MSELLVALDLDGTLEDSRADMVASVGRVRTDLGLPDRAAEAIVDHVHRGVGETLHIQARLRKGNTDSGDIKTDLFLSELATLKHESEAKKALSSC